MVWLSDSSDEMELPKGLPLDCSPYLSGLKTSPTYQPYETTASFSPTGRQSMQTNATSNFLANRYGSQSFHAQFSEPTTAELNLPEPCSTTAIDSSFSQQSTAFGEAAMISSAQQVTSQSLMYNSNFYGSQQNYMPWQQYGNSGSSGYPGYTYIAQGLSNPSGYGYPVLNNASLAAGKRNSFNSYFYKHCYDLKPVTPSST